VVTFVTVAVGTKPKAAMGRPKAPAEEPDRAMFYRIAELASSKTSWLIPPRMARRNCSRSRMDGPRIG
jgi:hypothetical protein